MQFSTRKAEYVIGLSQAIAEGTLDLEQFKQMDDEEVTAKLVAYRGVGPWTAQGFNVWAWDVRIYFHLRILVCKMH